VQILEHQYGWALLGERLKEPTPSRKGLGSAIAAQFDPGGQADQGTQLVNHPGRITLIGDEIVDGPTELACRLRS
jgi:hypothetical protein